MLGFQPKLIVIERKSGSPIVGLPLQSVEKVRLELGFF